MCVCVSVFMVVFVLVLVMVRVCVHVHAWVCVCLYAFGIVGGCRVSTGGSISPPNCTYLDAWLKGALEW
jgi:hypothetical protein